MKISAIIMASGFSERAAGNKLLYRLNGSSVIEYVLDAVLACGFEEIIVVTRFGEIVDAARKRGMKVVENTMAESGQSMSLKLGLLNAGETGGYAFFAGDQPFIARGTIAGVLKRAEQSEDSIVVTKHGETSGLPVFFPGIYKKELLGIEGDKGARDIIKKHAEKVVCIYADNEMELFDIDDENDLRTAIDYIERRSAGL